MSNIVGLDHIKVFKPIKSNHDEMVNIMKEELAYQGVSVVIPRRQCIQTMKNKILAEQLKVLNLK